MRHDKGGNPLPVVVGVAVAAMLLGVVLFGTVYAWADDWPTRGQMGDATAVANTSFSWLAFAGVVYAILLQRQELSLQRQELEETRAELKRSAEAQQQSARIAALSQLVAELDRQIERTTETAQTSSDATTQGLFGSMREQRREYIDDLAAEYRKLRIAVAERA